MVRTQTAAREAPVLLSPALAGTPLRNTLQQGAAMPIFIVWAETEEELRSSKGQFVLQSTAAGAMLGVHERRIREFVKEGALTPVPEKFGNSPLYLEQDLAELREKRKKAHY